jgi:hypothetical protein
VDPANIHPFTTLLLTLTFTKSNIPAIAAKWRRRKVFSPAAPPVVTAQRAIVLEGSGVESLERFTQNQRIIEEFVSQWLVAIPTALGRLAHVAMLRDNYTGRYHHPILQDAYSEPAVHQSLLYCHEELFEKVLENNFEQQEWDLRMCFAGMDPPPAEIAQRWLELELFRLFVPFGTPPYLRDLFCSNMRVILGLLVSEQALVHSAA